MEGHSLLATIVNSRITFLVVLVVGMAMCAPGIGKAAARGLWLHPITLAGYVLGATALLLLVQGLFRMQMLSVSNGLLLVLVFVIMAVKVALATLYPAMR